MIISKYHKLLNFNGYNLALINYYYFSYFKNYLIIYSIQIIYIYIFIYV